ncbi:MAG: hypothetical protein ACREPF_08610, partial [Rhodanobacteraceae bacterium]
MAVTRTVHMGAVLVAVAGGGPCCGAAAGTVKRRSFHNDDAIAPHVAPRRIIPKTSSFRGHR